MSAMNKEDITYTADVKHFEMQPKAILLIKQR
jgi:hypothetical protein